jgi:hypothetical protein
VQIAVTGNPGVKAAVDPLQIGYQSHQAQVIALIQGHETYEATRLGNGLWNKL